MNRRRRFFVLNALTALDGLVIAASYILTYILRDALIVFGLENLFPFATYFPYLAPIMVVWLLLLRVFNNYSFLRSSGFISHWKLFVNLIPVQIIGLSIISMLLFFLRDTTISRTFLLLFAVFNYLSLVVVRLLVYFYFHRMDRVRKYHRKALLIGHQAAVERFLQTEKQMPELLFDPIVRDEFTHVKESLEREEQHALFEKILNFVWYNVVDEVIISFSDIDPNALAPLINECNRMGIVVNIVMDTSSISYWKTEVDTVGPFNIITFQTHDYSPVQRFIKRIMDMTIGLLGCIIMLLILPFVALAIQISDPGPIFYVQRRKGKNGREFRLIKFRTMYTDADARKQELIKQNEMQGFIFKMKNDPRITPVGRFLRKTSIDEIPQFINIVKADMSLVGTRPPTVEEYKQYETHHRRRLSVQPGLTGLWQVSGRNEITDFEQIVKLDTQYIDNWSIWLDLRIILKTFVVVFSGR